MRPRFRYRIWRPRPEFRKVTPDIERPDLTHTVVEDLDGSPDHPMDADVLSWCSAIIAMSRKLPLG
jgi:hypothetical protein